jgi:asparagine synthase (glutamine-hydrolysing)
VCGFIGTISKNTISTEKLQTVNEKLVCRGPDKKTMIHEKIGEYNLSGIFNRLAIVDLSNEANQPMISSDDNYILFFNGEIYNHEELRNFLIKKGHSFKSSHSDTEALLYTFINYELEAPKKLRGQFSFVIFDKKNHTFYLCRDRLGQKPLYFTQNNNTLSFSSNLLSLSHFSNENVIYEESIYSYLNYGKTIGKTTIFQNINEVMPGEIVKINISSNGFKKETFNYWKLEDFYDNKEFQDDEFYNLFEESVNIRTNSDVPYATFLSGGLDSTSIIKSQHQSGKSLNTFSVYMNDNKFDESKYCENVANKYGTEHLAIRFDNNYTVDDIDKIISSLDEPFADPSYVPTYLLSNKISEHFKMAISGDGGDELLGGYLRVQKALKSSNVISSILTDYLYKLYPANLGTGSKFKSKNKNLNVRYNSFLADNKLMNLLGINITNYRNNQFEILNINSDYKTLMLYEYQFFLSQQMMYKVDRAAMANSLEVRSPFVDNKLLEYVFSHSYNYVDSNNPKSLLKNYLKKDFNSAFLTRQKQGFMFDVKTFVYKNNNYFYENTKRLSEALNFNNIDSLYKNKSRMNANRIWKLNILSGYINNL